MSEYSISELEQMASDYRDMIARSDDIAECDRLFEIVQECDKQIAKLERQPIARKSSNMLYTRKNFKEQYRVACWFVRYMHNASGIVVTDLNDYDDYYRGFRRSAKRFDGVEYPEIATGSHIWLHAVNAWQNNPNRKDS